MKTLCRVHPRFRHYAHDVEVVEWSHGDPFPDLGPSVGIDTETELITDTVLAPPVVVLGCFDPAHDVCYIVYWQDIPEFMRELCVRDVEQRYFNLGFDEQVIDNETEDKPLMHAVDQNRVVDMQIRIHLHRIQTTGFIGGNDYALGKCCKTFEGVELDKGDGTEQSARLSFKRYDETGLPKKITDEQAQYLPFDCIGTWCLGEAVPPLPDDPRFGRSFEYAHVKGMVVLAHISANGFPVDMEVYKALDDLLLQDMSTYREKLIEFGYPDPWRDKKKELADMQADLRRQYARLLTLGGIVVDAQPPEDWVPTRNNLKLALMYLYAHEQEPNETRELAENLKAVMQFKNPSLRTNERKLYDKLCETYGLEAVDSIKKAAALQVYVAAAFKSVCEQIAANNGSYTFQAAIDAGEDALDANPQWSSTTEQIGPDKFFQLHVNQMLQLNPSLKLNTTDGGKIKLAKDDMWRLKDLGIQDKFLDAYTGYKHAEKLRSTYLKPKNKPPYIKSDCKVHAKYNNIVRTGRVSCKGPNLQNVPKDKHVPLRNMYIPPEGRVLCATDFSFVELLALAESCYVRFGFSSLGDIINADVDPHRWFAGVRDGLISNDTSFTKDPKAAAEMEAFLKAHISAKARQDAKAANFGFGGGMQVQRFFENCRAQGIELTLEQAADLREKWIFAFPEMKLHLVPTRMQEVQDIGKQYYGYAGGGDAEDDEDDEDEDDNKGNDRNAYMATLINGMVRKRCSFCSSLNIIFQGLAAYGVKLAMWNLALAGYVDRLHNMIHDEVIYSLYPEELQQHVPIIEKLMIDGMRLTTPHVRVSVETSVMTHWNKGAAVFNTLKWDEQGNPILEPPPFVKELRAAHAAH